MINKYILISPCYLVEVYSGSGNPLSISRKYGSVYSCDLDLALYPFDNQQCFMNFRLTSALKTFLVFNANNSSVINEANNLLLEYKVSEILFRLTLDLI